MRRRSSSARRRGRGASSRARRGPRAGRGTASLAFGTDSLPDVDADLLQVDRPTWVGGDAAVASLWLADRERALEIARSASVFAFAAEPAFVVAPPSA